MAAENDKEPFELVGDLVRIFQRGQKWHANFQLEGRQIRKALGTTSKKEARRRAIQLEAELLQGRYQRLPRPPAIESVLAAYEEYLRTEGRAGKTISKYLKVFERVRDLAQRRNARTITAVNKRFVDAYRSERVEAEAAPKTVYCETVIVRQIVNFALSREMIVSDPLKNYRVKKPRSRPQPCWTPAEVQQILDAARDPERSKFTVLADTGMRVGELKYLTWDDVDFGFNMIQVQPKDDWQPKTGNQRAIPMSPRVRAVLESLPHRCRWVFTAARSAKYPKGDHQFSEKHLLTSLKRVLKRLGLPGHLHTFRHAFISDALTRGTPEAIVRQWVGHVDAAILRQYTHIADTSSQAAMQRLADGNLQSLQVGGRPNEASVASENGSAQNQHKEKGAGHG
jgi:integrase